ncbi:MAG: hypothetical protein AB7F51_16895 [Pseudorhodoplanes sp.]
MMRPNGRPRLSLHELTALIAPLGLDLTRDPVSVVGIRGYYRDTLGAPGVNDRGIYDDAIFLVSPSLFAAFNANTDPSRVRKGRGTGAAKGMASLKPGLYRVHRFDKHRGKYLALCQRAGPVTVIRDGNPPYEDRGNFGINIHRGGINTTSSEGCQTIPPDQWPAFIAGAQDQARRFHGRDWLSRTIPYVLIEERPR